MTQRKTLNALAEGETGTIRRVMGDPVTTRRIREMGVVPGARVTVERRAPLGDPIEVRVLGYHLSLRKSEADGIEVDVE